MPSNQSLPIWVISSNWTFEHNCPCFSLYMIEISYLISPWGYALLSCLFALWACGNTRQKPHNHSNCYVVLINIAIKWKHTITIYVMHIYFELLIILYYKSILFSLSFVVLWHFIHITTRHGHAVGRSGWTELRANTVTYCHYLCNKQELPRLARSWCYVSNVALLAGLRIKLWVWAAAHFNYWFTDMSKI